MNTILLVYTQLKTAIVGCLNDCLLWQIRDIVEAAGMVKDNYRKKMDSCLWYMQSINLPKEMKDRVRMWFLYNWEQQKTIGQYTIFFPSFTAR